MGAATGIAGMRYARYCGRKRAALAAATARHPDRSAENASRATPSELARPFGQRRVRPFEETLAELKRLRDLGQCFLGFEPSDHPDFAYY